MKVIIVAGFLGSGKTTLVLAVTEELIRRTGKKVSIVVNDFGAVGIDGKIMERYGLQVMELSSGCICCTLGPDLVKTVRELELKLDPDIVIIEPTGVADPAAISHALRSYPSGSISSIKKMVVIDALRFHAIAKVLGKQLDSQMKAANVTLINKVDVASEEDIAEVAQAVSAVSPSTEVLKVSALNGSRIQDVVNVMM